jgi:hypothetical protein
LQNDIIPPMNSLPRVAALRRTFVESLNKVRESRFFRDRLSMMLLGSALILNGLNLVWLALRVRPTDSQVPIRFSSFTLFNQLGPWYYPYLIALFALLVTLVNATLAYQGFSRSRLASFFLLIGSGVVAVFSFIISTAFGVVR